MPRNRDYRHDVRCPGCGSNWMRKYGHAAGRQAYRCGDCQRLCAPGKAYCRPGPEVKERALAMYAEGGSLSAVGRWVDFEVGDRSESPFLRLYERLPEAGLYRSNAYRVYQGWLPPERHSVGKGSAVNWP